MNATFAQVKKIHALMLLQLPSPIGGLLLYETVSPTNQNVKAFVFVQWSLGTINLSDTVSKTVFEATFPGLAVQIDKIE